MGAATKSGYKMTEVGLIPSDWELKLFEDVMDGFSSGQTPYRAIKDYYVGDIPWITSGELNYNIITDTIEKINIRGVKAANLKILPVGTFLFAITGLEAAGTRGSCAITGIEATTNQSCMALYPKKDLLINSYLYYYYVRYGDELAFKYCQGTKQQSYTGAIAKKLPIIVPPTIAEQTAIATALKDTDHLINSLESLIAKKKLIKQGVMQELLTLTSSVQGKPKEGWVTKKLGEIADISGAGIDKKINSNEVPVTLLNYMDIYKRDYIYRNELIHIVTAPLSKTVSCNVKNGDIFLTPSSELRIDIGISAIAMEDMQGVVYSYHIYRLRYFADIDRMFGLYMLKTHKFLSQAETMCEGSGKRYVVSMGKFKLMQIYFPISKDEQKEIASRLYAIDCELFALEQKLSKYQIIKQGMMQQLLTGKIRLI